MLQVRKVEGIGPSLFPGPRVDWGPTNKQTFFMFYLEFELRCYENCLILFKDYFKRTFLTDVNANLLLDVSIIKITRRFKCFSAMSARDRFTSGPLIFKGPKHIGPRILHICPC